MLKKFDQDISEGVLFTDQYQLMMAQLYFKMGVHEKQAQFDHYFRQYPDYGLHKAGYCINAGLEWLIDWMQNSYFRQKEIDLLKSQKTKSGKAVFENDFLDWLLKNGNYDCISMRAIPEGRVVHPNETLTAVRGPLAMAQILETPLLNQLNFQTLIATKASRIKEMGHNQLMMEFGARRAHDRGANAGVRGALIGGADFTSNVGISHILGFPPKGTHAHSMVQLFLSLGMSELDAFQAFADLYPEDCILLVDTINSLESGIPNAIKVFENMKKKGQQPIGIRLDSGDLAYLSIHAAKMLNDAGFTEEKIVLSNELDEMNIWQIITQITEEAPKMGLDADKLIHRLTYGVGTRLITSAGDASLGGVYKLVAVNDKDIWEPILKISEAPEKIPNPANKQIWRLYDLDENATADLLSFDYEDVEKFDPLILRHPGDQTKKRILKKNQLTKCEPLLIDILKEGKLVYEFPSIEEIRKVKQKDLGHLDTGVKRLINPHRYHVSLTPKLFELKQDLIAKMRG
ncbi:MAG: nicotinate phosphoribosyltransferase [Ignavibacteriaceae bacterium]|nr:nicotinate phosphoribosyltransferase [Ignavibacteriaceae bacterium]